jgi:hypothetical protein
MAATEGSSPSRHDPGRTHPAFWGVLLACLGIFVLVPVVITTYPLPDPAGGWCQSGGRPGHYTVESVAKALLFLDGGAVLALIAAAATLTPRFIWVFIAVVLGVIAFCFAWFVKAGTIDCAFW